jgi:hypothetical protein
MNRQQRRTARKQGRNATFIAYGYLSRRDQNLGLPVICFACDAQHAALGLARITHDNATTDVPLCEACLVSEQKEDVVFRKFLNAPDLAITEGGEATTEQVIALAEKQDTTEH